MAKWQGIELQDVYKDWAESMQELTLGAINHGIEESKKSENPPNQGEFIAMCKTYKSAQLLKIGKNLSPKQIEKNRARIAEVAAMLARSKAA